MTATTAFAGSPDNRVGWSRLAKTPMSELYLAFNSIRRQDPYVKVLEMVNVAEPRRYSMLSLKEYDLSKKRCRFLHSVTYSDFFLRGEVRSNNIQVSDWTNDNYSEIVLQKLRNSAS